VNNEAIPVKAGILLMGIAYGCRIKSGMTPDMVFSYKIDSTRGCQYGMKVHRIFYLPSPK